MESRFVFGPVPSRRLGRSLGIDTVPAKTCNWNCVYCQLGRSRPLTDRRCEFFPVAAILQELRAKLARTPRNALDWVTFVASGEGTLHRGIHELVRETKGLSPFPVAVITNGSLLGHDDVREALALADAVLPTLDAGDAALFRRINRPHRRLSFEDHVAGIESFARLPRRGRLWIEVMLIAGLNDSDAALHSLAGVLGRIGPDRIDLTLPTRSPAEPWVRAAPVDRVRRAQEILGAQGRLTVPWPTEGAEAAGPKPEREDPDLVAVVTRHPLRRSDVGKLYPGWPAAQVDRHIAQMREAGRIRIVERIGQSFIVAAGSRFPPSRYR